jgi:hypothetical protein
VAWSDVDRPVLEWVFEASKDEEADSGPLGYRSDEPSVVLGVSQRELAASLGRLHGYGLIAGDHDQAVENEYWENLRPTAAGLRVLGEWPPATAADLNRAVVLILEQLAAEAEQPEEAKVYRRAAGAVAHFGGSVLLDVAKGELRRLGGDIAG